jgi:large subunit ribosomal protein L24
LDLSTLTAWLTLHSVEQQSKRLEAIESGRRDDAAAPAAKHSALPPGQDAERAQAPGVVAPPLPAPIDIRPAPGAPARVSNRAQSGTPSVARKPAPVKPPLAITPPEYRPPANLSVSPQN